MSSKQPTAIVNRRQAIRSLVGGSLLMPAILSELLADESTPAATDPLLARQPHFRPKAKRVIFLFMQGGVSHLDSFDYKPKLAADHGKKLEYRAEGKQTPLVRPQWEFHPRGQSGLVISELFPHLAACADDLCVIRSMKTNIGDHFQDTLGMHTGSWSFPRPSLGAWTSYGLGTFNQNLPSFVVLAPHWPYAGSQLWASDFLPGDHQGTRVVPGSEPIPNIARRLPADELQQLELGLLKEFNSRHLAARASDPALAARIKSFETAFGMQMASPEAFDLSQESDATLALYGLARGSSEGFAWQCLMARRLAERGVRFIELIDVGASNNWDSHHDMAAHGPRAKNVDQAIAGLLKDLKARGMLDDTLVVWTTEFGRTPNRDDTAPEGATGRGHQATAFTSWLAGGGVKCGLAYGATDDYGKLVVENPCHVHDLHATILHLMGIDHERLTYRHAGRDFRLTDVEGTVVREIIA
jgi:hypothetical protein